MLGLTRLSLPGENFSQSLQITYSDRKFDLFIANRVRDLLTMALSQ